MLQQVYCVFKKNHGEMHIEIVPVGAHKDLFAKKPLNKNALALRRIFLNERSSEDREGFECEFV